MFRLGSLSVPFWMLLFLVFCGCGGSGGSTEVLGFSPSNEPTPSTTLATATVELRSELAQTTIPGEITTLQAFGYDQGRVLRYGPVSQEKSSVVAWTDVPVDVTNFVIEYLDANGQIKGLAQVSVQLSQGQTLVVDNPNILGISSSLEQLTITPATRTIALGSSTQFSALGTFTDGSTLDLTSAVSWSVEDPSIARVNQGRVEGLDIGSSSVVASFAEASAQASITVSDATLESLELSPESPAIAQGTSQAFTAEGFFSDGSSQDLTADVDWASSEPQVATIENGAAQGLQAGQTTIIATFGLRQASTVLTVTSATLESLAVSGGAGTMALGTSTEFVAMGTFSDGSTQDLSSSATWGITPPERGAVHRGRVTALSAGTATVTATLAGVSGQANIQVTDALVTSLRVETVDEDGSTLVNVEQALELRALATFSDGSQQDVTADATWTSEDGSRATVDAGVVTGEQAGQTFVNASFGGQSGELQVTVQDAPLPQLVLSGATFTFNTDTGELNPQVGDLSTAPGWNSSEGRLVLGSFTVEEEATLELTGDSTFRVKAETNILIAGELSFQGQDGANGNPGVDGGAGQHGGDIDLFSSGDLTVTGTITVNGGDGGNGGNFQVFVFSARSGNGGRGGDAGEVSLVAGDILDIESGEVSMMGGDGGNGGSGTIPGTGGAGGQPGGNPGSDG